MKLMIELQKLKLDIVECSGLLSKGVRIQHTKVVSSNLEHLSLKVSTGNSKTDDAHRRRTNFGTPQKH